jgi:ribosomal protein S18 acetylase RimI-like enzyme
MCHPYVTGYSKCKSTRSNVLAMTTVGIEIVTTATDEVLAGINRIMPQLSKSAPPMTLAELQEICTNDTVFIARHNGAVVGSLTLVTFRIPTGLRAWIEDVVVDEAARGLGIGEALNLAAIRRTNELGCRTLDLTSRPSRVAANKLYQKLGFKARETNIYRYDGPEFDS